MERLLDCPDWGEILFVVALLFDAGVAGLFLPRFLRRHAARHGDVVTPLIVGGVERDRERLRAGADALGRMLLSGTTPAGVSVPADDNRTVLRGWVDGWADDTRAALDALGPLFSLPKVHVDTADRARAYVLRSCGTGLTSLGLAVPPALRP